MAAEALAAAVMAVIVIWLVVRPLVKPMIKPRRDDEPLDPEETRKGIALAALKEIEFDRETGKLSDADYEFLKAKYTAAALEAIRHDTGDVPADAGSDDVEVMIAARVLALRSASTWPSSDTPIEPAPLQLSCPTCGPRPEADAVFCSHCGRRLATRSACDRCGATLLPGSRFCEGCGRQVAA
jgi:hypothetical protein